MTPETYTKVRALFDEAMQWPEGERTSRLQAGYASQPEVSEAVLRLIDANTRCDSFLQDNPGAIKRIGRYVVTGELGRGAMGVVYEALDPVIGRKIAVKMIRLQALTGANEMQTSQDQLLLEARSSGLLSHPGIVTVFDVGQEGDSAFIAMERVDGLSLDRIIASGRRFNRAEGFYILKQVAGALDYAHWNGVVHRDIKPANVMLDRNMIAKIADFGVAKIISPGGNAVSGAVTGTPVYMSPEQIEGLPSDGRSDQFSLALVAFELLTGKKPFEADTMPALVHMIVYANRPSAHASNPELPAAVDSILGRGLARSPKDRYSTCTEFVAALEVASTQVTAPISEAPSLCTPLRLRTTFESNNRQPGYRRYVLVASIAVACLAAGAEFRALRTKVYEGGAPAVKAGSLTESPPATYERALRTQNPRGAANGITKSDLTGASTPSGSRSAKLPLATGISSIKPSDGLSPANTTFDAGQGVVSLRNTSLKRLIGLAYNVLDFQIYLKDWMKDSKFDVRLILPQSGSGQNWALPLRKLIEQQLSLTAHESSVVQRGYSLNAVASGFKLQPADLSAADRSDVQTRETGDALLIKGRAASMRELANEIARTLGKNVIDQTGIESSYNFEIKWSDGGEPVESVRKLNVVLQEDLGLRLQERQAPVRFIFVDHIDGFPGRN